MLILHLYNDIPQLNLGLYLLRGSDTPQGDPERMRLSGTGGVAPKYTQVGGCFFLFIAGDIESLYFP